ncbi:MAG: murein L,D-transpeptidase catalytic domain family protein [Gemmatimonadota bacterium]|nr:murein L,D-transpeptidase catalytic domain family protein [Gemmatimonadota bacterium]
MYSRKSWNLLPTVLAAGTAMLYLAGNAYSAPRPGVLATRTRADSGSSATVAAPREADVHASLALDVLASRVRQLSHPDALRDAFRSYFTFAAGHPDAVRKPFLYFVDYGLSSTTPRGYVFDMSALTIVDGPFMVAEGRGSAASARGIPTRFSNSFGAATTSLGLYVAQELYNFTGHAGGAAYHSIGLRLAGVSGGFNSNARARGVVAHGAPYVTATRAGRSEGCPAMDPVRARTLLPKLASGGLVFLFAPDSNWMAHDPWLSAD